MTSPVAGEPVASAGVTVIISYSSDDPGMPLNLDSLTVAVANNGIDVAGTLTTTESQASFVPATSLVAGILSVQASFTDEGGSTASVGQSYEVLPTLGALSPGTGLAGDIVTVGGLGLDPATTNNVLSFASALHPQGISSAFRTVDAAAESGTVEVPAGATTGVAFLVVNGKRSREGLPFAVPPPLPECGDVKSFRALEDGGWIASYAVNSAAGRDPLCPPLPIGGVPAQVVHVRPSGQRPVLLAQCVHAFVDSFCNEFSNRAPLVVMPKNGGTIPTLLWAGGWPFSSSTNLQYHYPITVMVGPDRSFLWQAPDPLIRPRTLDRIWAADYDAAGSLYFVGNWRAGPP